MLRETIAANWQGKNPQTLSESSFLPCRGFQVHLKRPTLRCLGGCLRLINLVSFATFSGKKILFISWQQTWSGCNQDASQKGQLIFPIYRRLQCRDFEIWVWTWCPGEASNLWQDLENTLSNHFKAAFNWWWSFQVTLWIILQSADTKENKHERSPPLSHALSSSNAKKHRGAEVSAESCWRLDGCGGSSGGRGHDFSNQMSTHASVAEPLNPLHPHTHSWLWPLKVQLGWAQVTDRALLPDGNSRTPAFPPHSAGFTLLTFSFSISLFKQIPGRSYSRLQRKSGGDRERERAGWWCLGVLRL